MNMSHDEVFDLVKKTIFSGATVEYSKNKIKIHKDNNSIIIEPCFFNDLEDYIMVSVTKVTFFIHNDPMTIIEMEVFTNDNSNTSLYDDIRNSYKALISQAKDARFKKEIFDIFVN